jgi:hypothetical protein
VLDQSPRAASPDPVRCARDGPRAHFFIATRSFKSRVHVIADRQRQLGRGRNDACEADDGSYGDQAPNDLVEGGARRLRRHHDGLVGAGRRVHCQRGGQTEQRVRLRIEAGGFDRVAPHPEHRVNESLVVQREAAQRVLVGGHLFP